MTRKQPVDLAASVHRRLLNISIETGGSFNLLLNRYAIERLLYRLSLSPYANQFVLKGALLFLVWQMPDHRPTRDLDLLGYGDGSAERLIAVFRALCALDAEPDGVTFLPDSIQVRQIRQEQEYGGQRITMTAMLGKARIPVRVDVGFGDVVLPPAVETEYPALLSSPGPRLRVYPKETAIAEKLHAMVTLDLTNSRMKDFYDLWTLSMRFEYEGRTLQNAINATFDRRQTELSIESPVALTSAFGSNFDKMTQWKAFLRRNHLDVGELGFEDIVAQLAVFLEPPRFAAARGTPFDAKWPAAGPWFSD
jgi:predicted nucleotidyltransferase component of viral defense system